MAISARTLAPNQTTLIDLTWWKSLKEVIKLATMHVPTAPAATRISATKTDEPA